MLPTVKWACGKQQGLLPNSQYPGERAQQVSHPEHSMQSVEQNRHGVNTSCLMLSLLLSADLSKQNQELSLLRNEISISDTSECSLALCSSSTGIISQLIIP